MLAAAERGGLLAVPHAHMEKIMVGPSAHTATGKISKKTLRERYRDHG